MGVLRGFFGGFEVFFGGFEKFYGGLRGFLGDSKVDVWDLLDGWRWGDVWMVGDGMMFGWLGVKDFMVYLSTSTKPPSPH